MIQQRFILFASDVYYPGGGWNDMRGWFESAEDAIAYYEENHEDNCWHWYHVVDIILAVVVSENEQAPWSDR